MLYTLIIVTYLAGGPVIQHFENDSAERCGKMLSVSTEGIRLTHNDNVFGASKIPDALVVDGWTLVRQPVGGRAIARLRCVPK